MPFKKCSTIGMMNSVKLENSDCCLVCQQPFQQIIVKCAICRNVHLCLECFAHGPNFNNHLNSHDYILLHKNFSLFEGCWKAFEEEALVEEIQKRSNTGSVEGLSLVGKTQTECIHHYESCYLNGGLVASSLIQTKDIRHPEPIPYVTGSLEPPRPYYGSSFYKDMSGYLACRADFSHEYKDSAERDLANTDCLNVTDDVSVSLDLAIASIYNSVLKDRFMRKALVRDYGLINPRSANLLVSRYSAVLTSNATTTLLKFAPYIKSLDFDTLMEGLCSAVLCKRRILELQEMRSLGIRTLNGIKVYKKAKYLRDRAQEELRNIPEFVLPDFENGSYKTPSFCHNLSSKVKQRKSNASAPLVLVGLPGYEKLLQEEKEMCSRLRILPQLYLKFKSTLIQRCHDKDGLTLMQARSCVRIDVNKTRQVYQLLEKMGCIYKPNV
ncbi:transcriptional adapter 2-alpha-like isoform X2 [Artemia franciscana]|uniref:transcriptional adapter 2-alpha-like isoform X2 n=1 Tax=Artemia franciscana TaxID=6661 RepID=UPI0032DA7701